MRKALLIVAMLLLATPVMAATTITAVQGTMVRTPDGNQYVPISIVYSGVPGVDANVRAFALDINIDSNNGSPNFQRIRDFNVGEANGNVSGGKSGYGIFPSRFRDFIVVTAPNFGDSNYNPTTAWDEPETTDHNSGMGYPKMIVEMGTLYAGDLNRPAMSGTLFTFDVNSYGQVGTFNITIKANALRGGVVDNAGAAITPTLVGTSITFTAPGCTVPNVVGLYEAPIMTAGPNAVGLLTAAGLTVGVRTTGPSATVAAGRVTSQSVPATTVVACGSAVDINVSTGKAVCATCKGDLVANSILEVSDMSSLKANLVAAFNRTGVYKAPFVPNNVPIKTQAQMTTAIVNSFLVVGTITTANHPTVPAGSVISTTPAYPTYRNCNTTVNMLISLGP